MMKLQKSLKKNQNPKNEKQSDLICNYCNKSFKRETSFLNHICEQKRRFDNKNSIESIIAFEACNYWNRIAMGKRKDFEFSEFTKSNLYTTFIKFGIYVNSVNLKNWKEYLKWLTANNIPAFKWNKDSTYLKFKNEISKIETPERAVERFVIAAEEWAREQNHEVQWDEFWDKASIGVIINYVHNGKISPWIIFCSIRAQRFLHSLNDELMKEIFKDIDIDYWDKRIQKSNEDSTWIQKLIG